MRQKKTSRERQANNAKSVFREISYYTRPDLDYDNQ